MKHDREWAFFLGSIFGVLVYFVISTAMEMVVSV